MSKIFTKIGTKNYETGEFSLPESRVFREAWAAGSGKQEIVVDMNVAREIWRDKIRLARAEEFKRLDTEFLLALESGGDVSQIVAQKQALRDATKDPAIDAAKTPEELLKVKPVGLKVS